MSISSVQSSAVSPLPTVCRKSPSESGPATADVDGDHDSSASSNVKLSGPAQFIQKLKDLEASDPAKAKQVLTDLAKKLKAEAQGDGPNAKRAGALADKLQAAADSGDLSSLTPPAGGAKGGHHHGGGGGHHKGAQAYAKSGGEDLNALLDDELKSVSSTTTAAAA